MVCDHEDQTGRWAIKGLRQHSLVYGFGSVLIVVVLCSISLVSGLGYYELSKSTAENASIRVDRAARAAAAIFTLNSNGRFYTVSDDGGTPTAIRFAADAEDTALTPNHEFDRCVLMIGRTNQGAANVFARSSETGAFDRIATTFRKPDGSMPPPFSITEGHPAYESLTKGHSFVGNVPVQGRMRLATLMPIITPQEQVAGILAIDVGWADDLTLAKTRLQERILTASLLILIAVMLLGGLLLHSRLKPLTLLAKSAHKLASGDQSTEVPFVDRKDEIGDLALGLSRVTELQEKLHRLAYTDPITGAGNRARYLEDLEDLLAEPLLPDRQVALFHLDFVGFSKINDTYGQQAGNWVLLQSFARMVSVFGPDARIARISADDFTILSRTGGDASLIGKQARQVIARLSAPFNIEEAEIRLDARTGVALLPQDADDAETAHKAAGLALRKAKDNTSGNIEFFTSDLEDGAREEMRLENELREALSKRKLKLHFQPQIRPQDGIMTGLEALVRWPSGDHVAYPPATFIPIAEKSSLILELGQYVLEAACKQARDWTDAGFDFGRISVNVSPIQLRQYNFAQKVQDVLGKYGVPPELLCLEITESVFVDSREDTVLDILNNLGTIGIRLSLDDFGSGYSSLSYLHRLPFQEIKIDRSFLADADTSVPKRRLFEAITGLGKSLGLDVIAEGAETEAEFLLASHFQCEGLQGYFCSPPVPAAAVPAMKAALKAKSADAAPANVTSTATAAPA